MWHHPRGMFNKWGRRFMFSYITFLAFHCVLTLEALDLKLQICALGRTWTERYRLAPSSKICGPVDGSIFQSCCVPTTSSTLSTASSLSQFEHGAADWLQIVAYWGTGLSKNRLLFLDLSTSVSARARASFEAMSDFQLVKAFEDDVHWCETHGWHGA